MSGFGFNTPMIEASTQEKMKYFFVQLGGQAEMDSANYASFRNKIGVNDGSVYNNIGSSLAAFPFNGGVEPLPVDCILRKITVTGIVEETGIASVDIVVMKLDFDDGDTAYNQVRPAHTETITGMSNGRRFKALTAVTETADSTYSAGDAVSIAIKNVSGSGKHYLNGVSVILTFEQS